MWTWIRTHNRTAARVRRERRFVPSFEQLESRLTLAGNVTAAIHGGNLTVVGDNWGADIIFSLPRPGQIVLTGNDTTVNRSAAPLTYSGVTGDVRIVFGNGDDSLAFDQTNPVVIFGNLIVAGGKGSNTVSTLADTFETLKVGGNISILNLRGDTHQTDLRNLDVNGSVRIQNLGGDATVSIAADTNHPLNYIGGSIAVMTGPAKLGSTELSSIQVKGNVNIRYHATVSHTALTYGDQPNTISGNLSVISDCAQMTDVEVAGTNIGSKLQIQLDGSDRSTILLDHVSANGVTDLQTGRGDDTIFVESSTFVRNFHLSTSAGADSVAIGARGEVLITVPRLVIMQVPKTVHGTVFMITITRLIPESRVGFAESGPAEFLGTVSVSLGDGRDTLSLAVDSEVTFWKAAIFDAREGMDSALVNLARLQVAPQLLRFERSA